MHLSSSFAWLHEMRDHQKAGLAVGKKTKVLGFLPTAGLLPEFWRVSARHWHWMHGRDFLLYKARLGKFFTRVAGSMTVESAECV